MDKENPILSIPTQPTPVLIPGSRINRWIAVILDNFFLGLVMLLLILISQIVSWGKISLDDSSIDKLMENPFVVVIVILIWGLYKIGLLVKNEATPGKIWRKLKIVQNKDGKRINLIRSIVRETCQVVYFIPLLGTLIYLGSVLMVLFSRNRRSIHDFIAGTIVVQNQT
jgi:uncharacterized RDD family membrane protein YckC